MVLCYKAFYKVMICFCLKALNQQPILHVNIKAFSKLKCKLLRHSYNAILSIMFLNVNIDIRCEYHAECKIKN